MGWRLPGDSSFEAGRRCPRADASRRTSVGARSDAGLGAWCSRGHRASCGGRPRTWPPCARGGAGEPLRSREVSSEPGCGIAFDTSGRRRPVWRASATVCEDFSRRRAAFARRYTTNATFAPVRLLRSASTATMRSPALRRSGTRPLGRTHSGSRCSRLVTRCPGPSRLRGRRACAAVAQARLPSRLRGRRACWLSSRLLVVVARACARRVSRCGSVRGGSFECLRFQADPSWPRAVPAGGLDLGGHRERGVAGVWEPPET